MPVWLKRLLLTVLLIGIPVAVLPSYLWSFSLSGASEAPTILVGDTFIVNRAAYDLRLPYSHFKLFHTGSPRRGDIVQAILPSGIGLAIKRVIGLPGEAVEVRENLVIVNGRPLPVGAPDQTDFSWVPAGHRMGSTVVQEDGHLVAYTPGSNRYRTSAPLQLGPREYFLMGDNRDNSLDSRAFGAVSRNQFLGKAVKVIPTGPRLKTAD